MSSKGRALAQGLVCPVSRRSAEQKLGPSGLDVSRTYLPIATLQEATLIFPPTCAPRRSRFVSAQEGDEKSVSGVPCRRELQSVLGAVGRAWRLPADACAPGRGKWLD